MPCSLTQTKARRAPGPGPLKLRTAIQFSAEDAGIADAVAHAGTIDLDEGLRLRVVTVDVRASCRIA